MTGPVSVAADVSKARAVPAPHAPAVPHYLERAYWWAYVHPNAVRFFDRQWLVNLILFGNYGRLRDAALADLGQEVSGRTLQVACCYGDLTPILCGRLAPEGALDVVDILPVQLRNLAKKLPPDERTQLGPLLVRAVIENGPDLLARQVLRAASLLPLGDDDSDGQILELARRPTERRAAFPPERLVSQSISVLERFAKDAGVTLTLIVDHAESLDGSSKAVVPWLASHGNPLKFVVSPLCHHSWI